MPFAVLLTSLGAKSAAWSQAVSRNRNATGLGQAILVCLSIVAIVAAPTPSAAQDRINCAAGCVTYSVAVSPDGGAVSWPKSSGSHSSTFTVINTGNVTDTYTFTCAATGGITCGIISPSSLTLAGSGGAAPLIPAGAAPGDLGGRIRGGPNAPAPVPGAAAFASGTVTVNYTVGATSGTVRLTARGVGPAPATDDGFYNVTAANPAGPPVVALRSYNGDNQDHGLCLTSGAGEAAAAVCGDLEVSHALPGYATMNKERSLTLVYHSGSAVPQPTFAPIITEGGPTGVPNTVLVELSINGVVRKTVTYPGSQWGTAALATRQVSLSVDAAALGLATGAYPFSIRVQNQYTGSSFDAAPITGTVLVVNRSASEFGAGVWIAGVEQLVLNQPNGAILWVGGDGSARLYAQVNATTWAAPAGTYRDTLKLASSQYTRALRHGVTVTFDAQGRHIKTTNKAGHVTSFTWNGTTGLLTRVTRPPAGQAGNTDTLGYAGGKLDYIADPAGRRLQVTVSAAGTLTSLTDPDGVSTAFGYDPSRPLMTSRTNRRGFTTRYYYFNGVRLTRVEVPAGRTPTDNAVSTTSFTTWDERGRALAVDTNQSYTAIYGPRWPQMSDTAAIWVDRFGAPVTIVGPLGFKTTIQRTDSRVPAQATRVIYPDGRAVNMMYDARGNLTQTRDSTQTSSATTRVSTWVYGSGNATDSPVTEVDSGSTAASSPKTTYAYTAAGMLQQVTAPNGHVTKFAYNAANQVKAVTELKVPVWNQTALAEPIDSLHTGFAFNALGNVVADTSPLKRVTRYTRDAFQRVSDRYDPANHRVQYAYDTLNRVTDVTQYVGSTQFVNHTNIVDDVIASVVDPRGVTRSWQYDNAGRQIAETDDWNRTELRFYGRAGLLDSVRQRAFEGASGPVIRYVYDAAGRRTRMAWPTVPGSVYVLADSVTYVYDNVDRLTSATSAGTFIKDSITNQSALLYPGRKITRTYFGTGEIKREIQSNADGSASNTHNYTYDRLGRRSTYVLGTQASLTLGDSLTYTYRNNGQLQSIRMRWRGAASASTVADSAVFFWDSLGRRDSVRLSNKVYIKYAYDADGALRLVCGNDVVSAPSYPDVLKFTYNHAATDADGLVTSTATAPPAGLQPTCGGNSTMAYTQTNGYDGRHQLTTMNRDGGNPESHVYTYDASGNMTKDDQGPTGTDFDYTILANHNRLEKQTSPSGLVTRYLYDRNGSRQFQCPNATTCSPSQNWYRKYYYDGLGRMVGSDETSPTGSFVYYPLYDPVGRMLQAPDANIRLAFDGENVVRTNPDNSTSNWTIVHGPGLDDPLIAHFVGTDGAGNIQVLDTAYFATDGQGRQYAVGSSTGHDMTGDLQFSTKGGKYAGGTLNASSFSADRNSLASPKGLSFFRNRYYDQQTGRWTQEDPIGVAGGLNLYRFNGNNPVAYTDPFGLCIWDGCIAEFLVASAAVSAGIRFIANQISGRPAGEHVLRDAGVGVALGGAMLGGSAAIGALSRNAAGTAIATATAGSGGVTARVVQGLEQAGGDMEARTEAVARVIGGLPGQRVLMTSLEGGARMLSGGAGERLRQIILNPDGSSIVKAYDVANDAWKVVKEIKPQ